MCTPGGSAALKFYSAYRPLGVVLKNMNSCWTIEGLRSSMQDEEPAIRYAWSSQFCPVHWDIEEGRAHAKCSKNSSSIWWCTLLILAPGKLREENLGGRG